MTALTSPLVSIPNSRRPAKGPQVGGLVTVKLVKGDGYVECGARLEDIAHGTYFVKLVGLKAPEPYQIGDRFPLSADKIVDWD